MLLELAGGRRVVTVSVGEKQATALRIRVRGTAGHASIPNRADNAVLHAATAVERLLAYEAPVQLVPAVAAALDVLGAPEGEPRGGARLGRRPAPGARATSFRRSPG